MNGVYLVLGRSGHEVPAQVDNLICKGTHVEDVGKREIGPFPQATGLVIVSTKRAVRVGAGATPFWAVQGHVRSGTRGVLGKLQLCNSRICIHKSDDTRSGFRNFKLQASGSVSVYESEEHPRQPRCQTKISATVSTVQSQ
jgi:hypothetical protein